MSRTFVAATTTPTYATTIDNISSPRTLFSRVFNLEVGAGGTQTCPTTRVCSMSTV